MTRKLNRSSPKENAPWEYYDRCVQAWSDVGYMWGFVINMRKSWCCLLIELKSLLRSIALLEDITLSSGTKIAWGQILQRLTENLLEYGPILTRLQANRKILFASEGHFCCFSLRLIDKIDYIRCWIYIILLVHNHFNTSTSAFLKISDYPIVGSLIY